MSLRKRATNKATQKAVEKVLQSDLVPDAVLQGAARAVTEAVDKAVTMRWAMALRRADATEGTVEQRVQEVSKNFRKELTSAGAAAGAVAAAPVVGTGAAIATLGAEIGWLTMRSADLIMTIAAIHGHTEATVEERRSWVLAILAFGETAATEFASLADRMNVGPTTGKGLKMPLEVLERLNATLGASLISKFGTRRGALAIGRILPFGIGAVVGGGSNYAMIGAVAKHADAFFRATPITVNVRRIDGISVDGTSGPGHRPQAELPPPARPPAAGESKFRPWSRR